MANDKENAPSPQLNREDEDDRRGAFQPSEPVDAAEESAPPEAAPGPAEAPPPEGKKSKDVTFVGKLGKKQKKLKKDAVRNLDSWERYRALTDTLDEATDLVDLADHKARFALVIMAMVNVVLFFSADALDPLKSKSTILQIVLAVYLFVYVVIALYFFMQAIESLRPRHSQPQVPPADQVIEETPLGIRFYEDILRRDVDAYKKAWQEVRIGQLNAELAVQSHALAEINRAKFGALRRLYKGLQIMTVMAVGLVALGGLAGIVGTAKKAAEDSKDGERGSNVLGKPERITGMGVKEPSGVAFHPGLGHLFVVGDDGTMAELDKKGKTLRTVSIEKQIEDVIYHPPSGALLMVSEKRSELIVFDPVSGQAKKRWRIDTAALLGSTPTDGSKQGFEGLAFRPDSSLPGGGLMFLAHQRKPAEVVAIAFDPSAEAIGNEAVVARWTFTGYDDLTGLTFAPGVDRMIAIADSKERLLVLEDDGDVQTDIALPGQQQEGIAFDDEGTMWIADDKDKSVLRFAGALDALKEHLGVPSPSPDGVGGILKKPDILGKN